METMKRVRVRRLPVLAADGHVVGVLAMADIARDLGPKEPVEVEKLLAEISEPATLRA